MSSPFKVIAFIKAKAGISRDEFIAYYENFHAPLILEIMPGIIGYHRNYVSTENGYSYANTPDFEYDCVTEIWFESRATYSAALITLAEPATYERFIQDERKFLDQSQTRLMLVDEHTSKIAA